jgi:hypothetical protein
MFSYQRPDSMSNHIERNQAIALSSAGSEALTASSRKYDSRSIRWAEAKSAERLIRRSLALLDPAHLPFRKAFDLRLLQPHSQTQFLQWPPRTGYHAGPLLLRLWHVPPDQLPLE